MRPAWRLGTVPRLRGGASSWGGSDSPVQVELFQEALTPGVLRDRGQAGRLVLDGDPAHGQRPVRGTVRAERGAGGCRVGAGFGFPAAEEPDRVIPVAGPAGPALPFPGRGQPRPGRTRPGTGVSVRRWPHVPSTPVQRLSHTPPSGPPVHTHCDHHPGASRQCKPRCSAYPGKAVPRSAPSGVKRSLNLLYQGERGRPRARRTLTERTPDQQSCMTSSAWTATPRPVRSYAQERFRDPPDQDEHHAKHKIIRKSD